MTTTRGDFAGTDAVLGRAARLFAELGDPVGRSWLRGTTAFARLLAGRLHAARSVLRFGVRRPDLTGLLPAVTAPTLLVAGDPESPWPGTRAAEAAALAPFARVAVIPSVRDQVALDRPEAFTRVVRDFWSSLELRP